MAKNGPVPSSGPFAASAANQRDGIIFSSAERAHDGGPASDGIFYSQEYVNPRWRGIRLFIDLTARTGLGTLTVKVQTCDPASGSWADIPGMTTTALTAVATTTLTLYPGNAETANVDIADPLGPRWRVVATVATNHMAFSVGGDYLG